MSLAEALPPFGRGMEHQDQVEGFYRIMDQRLREAGIKIPKGARILEVGSGNGEFAKRLRKEGFVVRAIDLKPSPGVEVLDIRNLEKNDQGRFDFVISKHVFDGWHYTEQVESVQDEMLDSIRDALPPGGIYYAEEIFPDPPAGFTPARHKNGERIPNVYRKSESTITA